MLLNEMSCQFARLQVKLNNSMLLSTNSQKCGLFHELKIPRESLAIWSLKARESLYVSFP